MPLCLQSGNAKRDSKMKPISITLELVNLIYANTPSATERMRETMANVLEGMFTGEELETVYNTYKNWLTPAWRKWFDALPEIIRRFNEGIRETEEAEATKEALLNFNFREVQ